MRIFHLLRRPAALLLVLASAFGAMLPRDVVAAPTQEANFRIIPTEGLADAPYAQRGDLILASDDNIYFVSYGGGLGLGAIAKLAADGTVTVLHSFADSAEGAFSFARLMQASDGNLYGTTYQGGDGQVGTIFKVTLAGEFTKLRSLGQTKTDAGLPYTGLVQASDGFLYGTTLLGGDNNKGTVYRISTAGDLTIIHHFAGAEGENPEGTLIVGADGNLYGTTLQGGDANRGTIYRISTAGAYELLYSFPKLGAFSLEGLAINATGANPRAGLLLGADGNYYGTAYQGGEFGYGSFFRMTPDGTVSVVHHFGGASFDGGFPLAGVVQDAGGNFYGTTSSGGYLDRGSAWRVSSTGQFSLLHGFTGSTFDGSQPYAGLLLAHGAIYGATYTDQFSSRGLLFKLDIGTNGVLPIELGISNREVTIGESSVITWQVNDPNLTTCTKVGTWSTETGSVSGTQTLTPGSAGVFVYGLRCADANDVGLYAWTNFVVNAPPLQPVDGGASGGGALSLLLLLLLAALVLRNVIKESSSKCP